MPSALGDIHRSVFRARGWLGSDVCRASGICGKAGIRRPHALSRSVRERAELLDRMFCAGCPRDWQRDITRWYWTLGPYDPIRLPTIPDTGRIATTTRSPPGRARVFEHSQTGFAERAGDSDRLTCSALWAGLRPVPRGPTEGLPRRTQGDGDLRSEAWDGRETAPQRGRPPHNGGDRPTTGETAPQRGRPCHNTQDRA